LIAKVFSNSLAKLPRIGDKWQEQQLRRRGIRTHSSEVSPRVAGRPLTTTGGGAVLHLLTAQALMTDEVFNGSKTRN